MTSVPQWSLGGGENMTLIDETTPSGANSEVHTYTYGLVNPTAGAGTVSVDFSKTDNCCASAVNYLGTETASVAAATSFLNEDVNDTNTSTTVLSSGGSAGNYVYAAATFKGGEGTPASGTNLTEVADFESGTENSPTTDTSLWIGDGAAPDSCTITWSATKRNAGHLIEIVAALSSFNPTPTILQNYRNMN